MKTPVPYTLSMLAAAVLALAGAGCATDYGYEDWEDDVESGEFDGVERTTHQRTTRTTPWPMTGVGGFTERTTTTTTTTALHD